MNREEMDNKAMEQVIGGSESGHSDDIPASILEELGIKVNKHWHWLDEYTLPDGTVVNYADVKDYIAARTHKDSGKDKNHSLKSIKC